ncbi:hypothetical protein TWF225_002584 [Orbilia oligospora]|nr:hypothetical protein TWF225_002584 [Orbilia oligospora]KAF3266166.1 hypothetical protein TWF217_001847 [Orbilia oligospora]KAF3268724.1 hypothetical protein TWF128_007093 [Orbilia oligospora]KAF3268725.1 hypothetical protein TWF128_007093 [Orbilia oligospora]KAF3297177.1 hypothetical protein TWF132_008532 [Orbilia oligospora]
MPVAEAIDASLSQLISDLSQYPASRPVFLRLDLCPGFWLPFQEPFFTGASDLGWKDMSQAKDCGSSSQSSKTDN